VPALLSDHIEVYVFRRRRGRTQFLALRRARDRALPGVWQPVTGRRHRGETAFDAARREVREETGLAPRRWWALETLTLYFDPQRDAVVALPLFAAEVGATGRVTLSAEHESGRFLSASEAQRLFLWRAQHRGLEAVRDQILAGGSLADALAIAAPTSRPRSRPRAKGRTISPRRS
jgi:dATP pyrophosphohydrolase